MKANIYLRYTTYKEKTSFTWETAPHIRSTRSRCDLAGVHPTVPIKGYHLLAVCPWLIFWSLAHLPLDVFLMLPLLHPVLQDTDVSKLHFMCSFVSWILDQLMEDIWKRLGLRGSQIFFSPALSILNSTLVVVPCPLQSQFLQDSGCTVPGPPWYFGSGNTTYFFSCQFESQGWLPAIPELWDSSLSPICSLDSSNPLMNSPAC